MSTIENPRVMIPFGPVNGVRWVTLHALRRFRERSGTTGTAARILLRLESWMKGARPAVLKPGKTLLKMLNHDCRVANYWLYGSTRKGVGFILVIEGDAIVTVHRNESGEWDLMKDIMP